MTLSRIIQNVITRVRGERALIPSSEWPASSMVSLLRMAGLMALRGMLMRPFLGSAKGLLLVGKGVSLRNMRNLHVGNSVVLEDCVEIQALSKRGIHLSNNTSLGRYTVVRPTGNYGGAVGEGLLIGEGSSLGPYCYIGCSGHVSIGKNVMIGPRVSFFGENHVFENIHVPIKLQGVRHGPITVEDNVWIGSHVSILPNTRIGTGAVIASGAVVHKDVEPYSIVGGVPAKRIKYRPGYENLPEDEIHARRLHQL